LITINPFSPDDYQRRPFVSARDALLLGVDTALLRMSETFHDLTDAEYDWEPLPESERHADIALPAETKRVWRVFPLNGVYHYDYGDDPIVPSPFTTIAWIMNHIAVTADMYLRCIKSGKPAGEGITWDDLPVYGSLIQTRDYAFRALNDVKDFLLALDESDASDVLNRLTPAPWGEMRPTYLNLWTGAIEHAIQHAMQIAVRKEYIRAQF
jgi:hypothetical protein